MSITSKIKYRNLRAKGKIIKYSRATPVKFRVLLKIKKCPEQSLRSSFSPMMTKPKTVPSHISM